MEEKTRSSSIIIMDRSSRKCWSCVPVSPYPIYAIFIFYFFISVLNMLAVSDLTYDKVCFRHYGDLSLCSNSTFTKAHPELQDEATSWSTYGNLLQLVPSVISILLLSNYCDKVGHKVPMLLSVVGTCLACVWLAVLCTPAFLSWPMEWLLLYYLLSSVFGSFSMILMSGYSYVVLAATYESRAFHMAMAEGSIVIGMVLSSLASGPAIESFGLNWAIYINTALNVALLPIIIFGLKEIPKELADTFKLKDIFTFRNIKDAVKCVFKSRPGYNRLLIHLNIAAYCCAYFGVTGTGAVSFLFYVKEVGLTVPQYSYFNSVSLVLRALGAPILLKVTKRFNIDSFSVTVLATAIVVLGYVIQSLSLELAYIFAGAVLLVFQAVIYAVVRATLASIVERDELGKIFAYDAILLVVLTSLCTLCFNYLYDWSLPFWPSMYLAAAALLFIASLTVFIVMALIKLRQDNAVDLNAL